MASKYVYFFGAGRAEGSSVMRNLLGGKGCELAEMTNLGIPVPPGFTITTQAWVHRARYLGLDKTRLEHNTAAAAINLIRLDAWWTGKPLDRTRTTHLQRLDLAA